MMRASAMVAAAGSSCWVICGVLTDSSWAAMSLLAAWVAVMRMFGAGYSDSMVSPGARRWLKCMGSSGVVCGGCV